MSTELMNQDDSDSYTPQVLSSSEVMAYNKAEIDQQISTAKRYPRSFTRFIEEAKSMVSISPELAQKCSYALERTDKGSGKKKWIIGPSVRMAEIVAVAWTNCRIIGRVTADDGRIVTLQGAAHDLEKNVFYGVESKIRTTYKDGNPYNDDMRIVATNAGIAKVTRNATFKIVPRAYVDIISKEARAVAGGELATLGQRANDWLTYFRDTYGILPDEIYAVLDVAGFDDIGMQQMTLLTSLNTSIEEGHRSAEEIFRPDGKLVLTPGGRREKSKADRMAEEAKATAPTSQPAPVVETPPPVAEKPAKAPKEPKPAKPTPPAPEPATETPEAPESKPAPPAKESKVASTGTLDDLLIGIANNSQMTLAEVADAAAVEVMKQGFMFKKDIVDSEGIRDHDKIMAKLASQFRQNPAKLIPMIREGVKAALAASEGGNDD